MHFKEDVFMKIGLQIVRFNWSGSPDNTGEKLAEIARTAEATGFNSLWVMDHYYQIAPGLGSKDDPMLEGYSALHYLAAVTRRIELGTMVSGVIYREPAFLVKTATALDVLSEGRAYFGVGAAWYEQEAVGMGFSFPPIKDRFEMLEEMLQIAKQMWAGDNKAFKGKHYQLKEPISSPQPLSDPHPPILIGGMGEKKTLRLVAQYADACNLFARVGNEELSRKLDILKRHCDDLGRDYAEVEKTSLATVHLAEGETTPGEMIRTCTDLADLGFQHAIFNMPNVHEIDPIETIGQEVIPEISGL
jgi:F420-dependent oxidoreductase-like protein